MNIENRLKKIESRITEKEDAAQIVWDFSRTTTAQLHRLKELIEENEAEAAEYTGKLITEGFLSYRNEMETQSL